jgi:L-ascorbate metabolism protein UlaG (beta-lactamase superfamily)
MLLWLILCPLALITALFLFAFFYLKLPKFGALPSGERLERVSRSPHYREGKFQNLVPTPRETHDGSEGSPKRSLWDFFSRSGRVAPRDPLPAVKSDLKSLAEGELVWFGHSSFIFRLRGRIFLVDPIFSQRASPLWFGMRAYPGTSVYSVADLPPVDYLLISHDHWDHLDYPTVMALRETVGLVICGLGVGAHFERWGFPAAKTREGEWGDSFSPEEGIAIDLVTARHFSGRGLTWDQAMWTGFVIRAGGRQIYYSGDGGYGTHFREAGAKFGSFDLALLEDGQYDLAWKRVHMMPEETVRAGLDLNAKAVFPVHNMKFSISYHDWDDPLLRARAEAQSQGVSLVTPLIGQKISLGEPGAVYPAWWLGLN